MHSAIFGHLQEYIRCFTSSSDIFRNIPSLGPSLKMCSSHLKKERKKGCSGGTTPVHTSCIAEASPGLTTVKMNELCAIKLSHVIHLFLNLSDHNISLIFTLVSEYLQLLIGFYVLAFRPKSNLKQQTGCWGTSWDLRLECNM